MKALWGWISTVSFVNSTFWHGSSFWYSKFYFATLIEVLELTLVLQRMCIFYSGMNYINKKELWPVYIKVEFNLKEVTNYAYGIISAKNLERISGQPNWKGPWIHMSFGWPSRSTQITCWHMSRTYRYKYLVESITIATVLLEDVGIFQREDFCAFIFSKDMPFISLAR